MNLWSRQGSFHRRKKKYVLVQLSHDCTLSLRLTQKNVHTHMPLCIPKILFPIFSSSVLDEADSQVVVAIALINRLQHLFLIFTIKVQAFFFFLKSGFSGFIFRSSDLILWQPNVYPFCDNHKTKCLQNISNFLKKCIDPLKPYFTYTMIYMTVLICALFYYQHD